VLKKALEKQPDRFLRSFLELAHAVAGSVEIESWAHAKDVPIAGVADDLPRDLGLDLH